MEGQRDVAGIAVTDPPYLSLSARGIKFARCQYRCRQRLLPLESVNIPLYALLRLSIKRLHIISWTRLVRGFNLNPPISTKSCQGIQSRKRSMEIDQSNIFVITVICNYKKVQKGSEFRSIPFMKL